MEEGGSLVLGNAVMNGEGTCSGQSIGDKVKRTEGTLGQGSLFI